MSAEVSPSVGRRYGLQRVCQVLDVARSSLYAARQRSHARRDASVRRFSTGKP